MPAQETITRPNPPAEAHPSGDNRFKILESTMKRHQYEPDALIEVLHHAQQLWGYLEDDLLIYIAHKLKVPPSRVYGVATFYHFFSLKPRGRHTCVVCLGTACYVKGGTKLMSAVTALADIKPGETTRDSSLSLLSARCLGACGIAPATVMDGAVAGYQTEESLTAKIKEWLDNGSE
jgi:bidirectional [NiFe] hydrogenase diaphorase subunit